MGFAAGWNAGVNMAKARERIQREKALRESIASINESYQNGGITQDEYRWQTAQALQAGGAHAEALTAIGQMDQNTRQEKDFGFRGDQNAQDRAVEMRGQDKREGTALAGHQVTRDVADMRNQTDVYGINVRSRDAAADRAVQVYKINQDADLDQKRMQMGEQQFWAAHDQGAFEFGEGMKVKREELQVERDKFAYQRVNDYLERQMKVPEGQRQAILARGEEINAAARAAFASKQPKKIEEAYEKINDGVDVTYDESKDGLVQLYANGEKMGPPASWEDHAARIQAAYLPEDAYRMALAEYTRNTKGQSQNPYYGVGDAIGKTGTGELYAPDLDGNYQPITLGGSGGPSLRERAEMATVAHPNYANMTEEQRAAHFQQVMQRLNAAP